VVMGSTPEELQPDWTDLGLRLGGTLVAVWGLYDQRLGSKPGIMKVCGRMSVLSPPPQEPARVQCQVSDLIAD
jgi:hypothetical protein